MSTPNLKVKVERYNNRGIIKSVIKHYDLLIMMLPGFIALIVFSYMPMYGLVLAFKDYKMMEGIMGSDWVGLKYFKEMFSMPDFYKALKNTFLISILKMAAGFPAPIILALLLNEIRSLKYKKLIQNFTYLPHFFSWVVLAGIIRMLFTTNGPINNFLTSLGINNRLEFFADGNLFLGLIVGTSVWQSIGWGSVVYIATISGIDDSLYEATYIDGANRWKQAVHITLPCLVPTIITVFILNLGYVLNAGFDQIFNLYNPVVYESSDIIDTYVFRKFQQVDYSFGTAVGLFKSVVGFVLVVSANLFIKNMTDNEQGIW